MLDGNALDTTGAVGLPVLAFGERFFFVTQVIPPAEFLQHVGGKFRVAVLQFIALWPGTLGQQVDTIVLDTETGTEIQTTARHRLAGVVEVRCTGMPHLGGAPAGPGHTVIIAVGRATPGLEAGVVEGMPVLLVLLQAFRTLAGIADGPHTLVEFAGDVLDIGLVILHRHVLAELLTKAELAGHLVHNGVVRQRLE